MEVLIVKISQRKGHFLSIMDNGKVNLKKEMLAGLTTFLTMAYIIAVNPSILASTGMPAGALVTATCLAAALGCFIMGIYANLPFALASGMGLNAYFAYTVVGQKGVSWQVALTAVFVEGIIFIILSLFKIREAVANAIPKNMKLAVSGGIGLFIAFIGMINGGIIVANESTLVALGKVTPAVMITIGGLILITILDKRKIRGAILWGIIVSAVIAWIYAYFNKNSANSLGITIPQGIIKFESINAIAGKLDFSNIFNLNSMKSFITVIFTFLFVDFFDTVGTLVGVCSKANMLDEKGEVPNVGKALMSDAIATSAGAALGVSTVTTYVESATGVSAGGRTGYTAVTTGFLFLIAMFFSPIFVAIPSCATAPALIYVGYLMLSTVKDIEFNNITEGVPAFLTIASMPLTYSIGDGLTIGILSYVLINSIYNIFLAKNAGDKKKVSWIMVVLAVVFILKIIFL